MPVAAASSALRGGSRAIGMSALFSPLMSDNSKKALLGMSTAELCLAVQELGLPAFNGKQVASWIYGRHVTTIGDMGNLSKKSRECLNERFEIGCRPPVSVQRSADGTAKYLFSTRHGDYVETVYIPETKRATLCVSSQVGCKMGCVFCMTGRQGYVASLDAADILNQIYSLPERERLTNIVFMGQGEPFDNLDAVLRAATALTAPWGYGWSPKRITVSSVGLRKGLLRFLDESKCHLAISLHNPFAEERERLMPAEKAFGIEDVVRELERHDSFRRGGSCRERRETSRQRRLSFEYIVFKGVNDSRRHADAIIRLLRNLDCRVNLIRFHSIPDTPLQGVDDSSMLAFRDYLTRHGLFSTVRASRGQDIFAACGLLSTLRQEEEKHRGGV